MASNLNRLIKISIALIFYPLWQLWWAIFRLFKAKLPSNLVILTYHAVTPEQKRSLSKQMDILLRKRDPIRLNGPILQNGSGRYVAITFDDGYKSVIQNAFPILQERKIPFTLFITTGAFGTKPPWINDDNHPFAAETILSLEELKSLPDGIVTIGSHTVSHARLSGINKDRLRREIADSKDTLQSLLGRKITLISVPYGQFDQKLIHVFEEEGYERVFLNIPTFPITSIQRYLMGRIGVDPTDWEIEYRLKLAGAYQWLPMAIYLKSKLF